LFVHKVNKYINKVVHRNIMECSKHGQDFIRKYSQKIKKLIYA
jgi:hypothetical protein